MIKLTTNVLGTFALKNGSIVKRILFPRDPKEISKRLMKVENSVCEEEIQLIEELKNTGNKSLSVANPQRFYGKGFDIDFVEDKKIPDPLEIARDIGVSEEEFTDLVFKSNLELTKMKLKEVDRDQLVIQAVSSLDDLDDVINRMMERLREWYSLNFPEMDSLVKSNKVYASVVNSGTEGIDPDLAEKIKDAKKNTLGTEFSESDISAVRALSGSILELYSAKERIENYLEELMQEISPNISALAGPLLGARLISHAGGLKRLSALPASTIQILGAENAFFQFLRTKKNPPKHGIIFQFPEIRKARKSIRGRISRTFAAKIAIAAKADYFHGGFIGEKLRQDFMKRLEYISKNR